MRVAVFLLLLAVGSHCYDNYTFTMEKWESCTKRLRTHHQPNPEKILLVDVLAQCHHMRTETAGCLAQKLNIDNDGSAADRGRVFVEMIDRTNRNKEVIQLTRFYHYACLYNDIGTWIRNHSCYFYMIQNCVLKDGDCYGMKCRSDDQNIVYKTNLLDNSSEKESANSHLNAWVHLSWVLSLLMLTN